MSVTLSKGGEIPKDAVVLSEFEATTQVWDLIDNWDQSSETWALNQGANILGAISGISGMIINQYYRRKLQLGRYGHLSSVLPIIVIPGALTMVLHKHSVTTSMLLQKAGACPICYEVRSAAIQLGFGVMYPMLLAPLSAFMFANRYATYRLPSIATEPKQLFKLAVKISKPLLATTIGYIVTFHLISSSILTFFELQNTEDIMMHVREIERKLDSKLNMEF